MFITQLRKQIHEFIHNNSENFPATRLSVSHKDNMTYSQILCYDLRYAGKHLSIPNKYLNRHTNLMKSYFREILEYGVLKDGHGSRYKLSKPLKGWILVQLGRSKKLQLIQYFINEKTKKQQATQSNIPMAIFKKEFAYFDSANASKAAKKRERAARREAKLEAQEPGVNIVDPEVIREASIKRRAQLKKNREARKARKAAEAKKKAAEA